MRPLFRAVSKRRSAQAEEMSLRTQCHQVKPKCLATLKIELQRGAFLCFFKKHLTNMQFRAAILLSALMPHIRFHDLRHSCATLLFAQGDPMKEIQAWLGHSTIGTTANIYTHLDENSKINSANAIIGILEQKRTLRAFHLRVSAPKMVPPTGIEPVRFLGRGILSPLCLPVPPWRPVSI